MKHILITYAVKGECIPISLDGYHVSYLFTGIGKARSAMKLTEAIMKNRPDMVINMGTGIGLHGIRNPVYRR